NRKRESFDVAIIGGGIGGLMAANRLTEKNPGMKVVLLEKGPELGERHCPIIQGKTTTCVRCPRCSIMEGMAGAGAFSDGKYVISTEYGGWLTDYMPDKQVLDYIEQADAIMVANGATADRFMPDNALKKICIQHDLHMQQAQLKHLGTDSNFDTMLRLIQSLRGRVDIRANTEVVDVDKAHHLLSIRTKNQEESEIEATDIIFAVGRVGSVFFSDWCRKNGVRMMNNQIDIGVRVELPYEVWEDFSSKIYEPKILYRSKSYGDTTRMFCFNEKGNVVMENTDGILTVNGHSYHEQPRKTKNSNFALLNTIRFTQPFDEPIAYARAVASLANMISGGSVLVQRLGDLEQGRRTNEHRMSQSTTRPTLEAVPGDLSLCMPKRQLDNIIETLHKLDEIAPGTANHNTLLYGVECKYYSARPAIGEGFELEGCKGIYAVGDGAGFTRSLAQAAAHGLAVGDRILASR
ncbi:MAG: FAD-dependent oxidoreductase, partial [Oscillospiraceae bacterium]